MRPTFFNSAITNTVEGFAKLNPRTVLSVCRPFSCEDAGEYSGCNHRWRKACTFLVCPIYDFNGSKCFVTSATQCPHSFQRGKNAERTVKFSPARLSIQMAPNCNWRNIRPLPAPPREHRAHIVNSDYAAERLSPLCEPIAHLSIEIGECKAADSALRGRADRRRFHKVGPQTLSVDRQIFHCHTISQPK